jgi:membrane associated rhomboid family serine protease
MSVFRKPFRYRNDNVVFVIIGLNILVFLLGFVFGNSRTVASLISLLPMRPIAILRGYIWQFVTYMFVHDPRSFSHIFFNMFALFVFGSRVEGYMGSREFLLYYFVTGTLAGVFSFIVYFFTGAYWVALMGASGAIFAVELAYAVFFPQALIYLWGILPLRAPVMVLGFTAVEIIMTITGRGGNVAHITHLAGFGFGWIYFRVRFGISPWRRLTGR